MKEFQRDNYYSQTEVLRKYKISLKKFRELNLPHVEKKANLGLYEVTALYFLKDKIHNLNLPLREN